MAAHIVPVSLCFSSQPEGATPEEEAVHLSEEGIPGSGSGSRVVGINPRLNGRGSVRALHPREQNYHQGMTPFSQVQPLFFNNWPASPVGLWVLYSSSVCILNNIHNLMFNWRRASISDELIIDCSSFYVNNKIFKMIKVMCHFKMLC